jgi:hypothetical protein
MIATPMRQTLGSEAPRTYAVAMAGLWIDLRSTLARLDGLAGDLDYLCDERETLPALQYDLHRASELVAGLEPPNGSELVHEELSEALTEARETTADIAEALDHGGVDAAAPLVWEWRGVLFRVRLARIRLERPRPAEAPATAGAAPAGQPVPFFAAGAVAVGSALVLFAALLGLWLLVALVLAGTGAAAVLLRP